MTTAAAARPLTVRLKDDNWKLHQIAERTDRQADLIRGRLPRDGYVGHLTQHWFMARALDAALRPHLVADPTLDGLVLGEQLMSAYLEEDLTWFGVCPAHARPEPGAARFIDEVASNAGDAWFLLGLHYVRLGACNGNRFVARAVRKGLDLPATGEGTRFLDPFGEAQRDKWYAFKAGLDGLDLTPDQADRVFEGTEAAYVHAICHTLPEHATKARLLAEHEASLDKRAFEAGHSVHVPG